MSINNWTPEKQLATNSLESSALLLKEYIKIGSDTNIELAIANLSSAQIDTLTPLMKQSVEFWHRAADQLETEEIIHLMRFFTIAEEKNSQLFSGKQSPVIALNKLLKKRNTPLPKEELLWIKSNSTNRFLPNGSVL